MISKKIVIVAIVVLLIFGAYALPSHASANWWNSNWLKHSSIIIQSGNGSHTNEPIIVNVSTIPCYFSNKKDLRIVLNNTTEIPFQYSIDYDEIVFIANISGTSALNTEYSAYCNNSVANWGNTTTLFLLTETFNNQSLDHWVQLNWGTGSLANDTTLVTSKEKYAANFNDSTIAWEGSELNIPSTSGVDFWIVFDFLNNKTTTNNYDIGFTWGSATGISGGFVWDYNEGYLGWRPGVSDPEVPTNLRIYDKNTWYTFNTRWKKTPLKYDVNITTASGNTTLHNNLPYLSNAPLKLVQVGSKTANFRGYADRLFISKNEIQLYPYVSNASLGLESELPVPPIIIFILPTPNNESIKQDWAFINLTLNKSVLAATLEWNGTNETMLGNETNWFKNKTSLIDSNYTFKAYANDATNLTGASEERYVVIDAPPAPITNLNETNLLTSTSIPWNWTNPTNSDYNHAEVYLDGTFKTNVSTPSHAYTATGLAPNTTYELEVRPVDNAGNIGEFTNDTAQTKCRGPCFPPH